MNLCNGVTRVKDSNYWSMRCLALVHYAWGMVLLLLAAWFVIAALMVLPHMSGGSIWTHLLSVLSIAAWQSCLPGMLGVWMVIIGYRTWTANPGLRKTLLISHGILLGPGLLAAIVGVYAVGAAGISSSRGGGLLSPVAYLPLGFGLCVAGLATISVVMALVVVPKR
jgi:hypothetical protein